MSEKRCYTVQELQEILGAVSYTHLDVYKRQVCIFIVFADVMETAI